MAYIGNQLTSVPHIIDTFSGDNSTKAFGPLVRAPAGVAAIAVFISGSYKTPGVDYTLNGTTINFTTAPASGTNNIVVHHLGNGSSTQVPSDASVTTGKIVDGAVTAAKLETSVNTTIQSAATTGKAIAMSIVFGG